jgi:signal transduction histidine kinase/sugar lactone lactonase YvrE
MADMAGIVYFDKKTFREKRVLYKRGINNIYMLNDGRLMLPMADSLYFYDVRTGTGLHIPVKVPGKNKVQWNSVVEDTMLGYAYVAEINGGNICKLNLATLKPEIIKFQDNKINRLFIDRSQNLWVGTDGGGAYRLDIKPPKFRCYAPGEKEEATFMVKSIFRDASGMMWMGVFGKGVVRYDPVTKTATPMPLGLPTDGVQTGNIMVDSSGGFVLTIDGRITWWDTQAWRIKKQAIIQNDRRSAEAPYVVYSLLEWKKGRFLAGGNCGIYSVNNENGVVSLRKHAAFFTGHTSGWVYNLYKADDGSIYIGKRSGYTKIKLINDSTLQVLGGGFDGLPIRHFYKSTTTPILWLATEQGLVAYNESTKEYRVFDESAGIGNSYIYAILPQNDSVLWVSTNNGISRVAAHYGKGINVEAKFSNYTAKDGLQSNEFNTGAFFKAPDGTLMFGGIAGVNWFHPADVLPNPYYATPAVTGVYVNDTLIAGDTAMYLRELRLPYYKNTLSFTLKALEYTLPEKNSFAYMLEGVDKDWVYTATDKVRYANLAPGNYRFLLKVANNEGKWNEHPLEMQVIIYPPYWQTWWFRALIFLAVVSVVILIVRYYIRQRVLVKTRELEKQHALNMERLRISKDVHDDIGSGLSKISLHSAIASRKILDNQAPGRDIEHISSISKELVDNMRDLIWVLNPENTTLDHLVSRIREYCADYLDGMKVNALFIFPDEVPDMDIAREVQRSIFSTIKEAVNNCVKYSKAEELKIELSVSNSNLAITLTDNGVGFAANEMRSGGNGLRNMKQRMELIGGQCSITSEKCKGTEVAIVIPLESLNARDN